MQISGHLAGLTFGYLSAIETAWGTAETSALDLGESGPYDYSSSRIGGGGAQVETGAALADSQGSIDSEIVLPVTGSADIDSGTAQTSGF